MGWRDKWLRQDTRPVCGRHETCQLTRLPMVGSKQGGQRHADLAVVPSLGDLGMYVFPTGTLQEAGKRRPGCGSGPWEDHHILLKHNELKARGGPRTMQLQCTHALFEIIN